ncbi:hypothetical protein [Pontibacter kalidii]|uniref:hypothetical protein n=1 Tax=Pontibacter kalidii TaxID=2592049 RepID=UPI0022549EBD|nr:hypothetical protein [Pontibacter kalidii]
MAGAVHTDVKIKGGHCIGVASGNKPASIKVQLRSIKGDKTDVKDLVGIITVTFSDPYCGHGHANAFRAVPSEK